MRFAFNLFVLFLIFTLTGCAWVSKTVFSQTKDKSYLYAKSIPPLNVPPGLRSDKFHAKYPVSGSQYSAAVSDISIIPPGLRLSSPAKPIPDEYV